MTVTRSEGPLRVGVIGLGVGLAHIKAYAKLPGVTIMGLAGIEDDKRAQLGADYNIPYLHRTYEELLEHHDIDAVSICVPNALHAPVSLAALRHGKHVLCEKPLARNGTEARAIVDAARDAKRVVQTVFNHRRRGDVEVLKRSIDRGNLGRIYHAKASWMRRRGIPTLGSWFTNKELAGGGPLIDLGVHMLDMALYLLNEPAVLTVSAATYAELGPRGRGADNAGKQQVGSSYEVEDLATAFMRLAGGGTLLLEASWATHGSAGDDYGVTLFGTEGGGEIKVKNYAWDDTLRIYTDVADVPATIRPQVPKVDGHFAVVRDFVETIRAGNWSAQIGTEGLRRVEIIDACYQSAREGREVILDQGA